MRRIQGVVFSSLQLNHNVLYIIADKTLYVKRKKFLFNFAKNLFGSGLFGLCNKGNIVRKGKNAKGFGCKKHYIGLTCY